MLTQKHCCDPSLHLQPRKSPSLPSVAEAVVVLGVVVVVVVVLMIIALDDLKNVTGDGV